MWVKGSGCDLATMRRSRLHGAAPRRGDAAVRARRDERRGDGRLPRALPARPRRAALLDRDAAARVHPGGPRRTTPTRTRSTRSPAPATASALVAECFGDEAAWIDYIRPGFTLAKQVGDGRARATPACGSSCSPSTASSSGATPSRRPTAARSRSSTAPPSSSTSAPAARRASAARARAGRRSTRAPGASACATILPALRGALSRRAREGARASTSRAPVARVRRLGRRAGAGRRSAPPAPTTSSTPSGCRCGSPSTRRPRTRRRCRRGSSSAPRAYRDDVPRLRRAPRRRGDGPAPTPTPRVVLIQGVGLVAAGTSLDGGAHSRATSTTARSR